MQNLLSENKSVEVVTKMMKNISLHSCILKASTFMESVGGYREFADEDAMEVTYETMGLTKLRTSRPKIFGAFNDFEQVEYMEVDENPEETCETTSSSVGYFTGTESDDEEDYKGYNPADFDSSSEDEEIMEIDGVHIECSIGKIENTIEKDSQSQKLFTVAEEPCDDSVEHQVKRRK